MEHRRLGHSGTLVSRLALGSMYFGGETTQQEAFAIIDACVEAGGNLIDIANVHMGGRSEAIVGQWFASRPREIADRVVLASKGRHSTHQGPDAPGLSRPGLHRLLDESLRNLGRDRIDLYQLHAWDPLTPAEETSTATGRSSIGSGRSPNASAGRRPRSPSHGWRTRLA